MARAVATSGASLMTLQSLTDSIVPVRPRATTEWRKVGDSRVWTNRRAGNW